MAEKNVKMYVTKWWATKGILKLDGRLSEEDRRYFSGPYCVFAKIGKDAFATEAEAQAHVRSAAEKKYDTLLKQAAKVAKIAENGAKVVDGLK